LPFTFDVLQAYVRGN